MVVRAAGQLSSNDFKNGLTVELDGQPFRIMGESVTAGPALHCMQQLHPAETKGETTRTFSHWLWHCIYIMPAAAFPSSGAASQQGHAGDIGFSSTAEFLHVKPGKGAAFVRSKLKNYVTGNTVERTFRAGEMVSSWAASCGRI